MIEVLCGVLFVLCLVLSVLALNRHRVAKQAQFYLLENTRLQAELVGLKDFHGHSLAQEKKQSESMKTQFEQQIQNLQAERQQLQSLLNDAERKLAQTQTQLQAEQTQAQEKMLLLQQAREELSMQFKVLANDILQEKSQHFTEHNRAQLDTLLAPLKVQLGDFKQKIELIHQQELVQHAEFKTELKQLQQLNQQMTEEAHGLATALKGQSKLRGNWGEMVLENILERAGLTSPHDYQREVSFNTDDGRLRPDVVVYLPQKKHLVIDAKVSLNDYLRYVNAENGVEQEAALKDHLNALNLRVRELSNKEYHQLPGLNSPEVVFMFVPIESALVDCLRLDELFLQRALDKNILIATPTTLLASLNIVRQLWRLEKQSEHSLALADRASKMYKKLQTFLASMDEVGKQLDKARESHQKAVGQLCQGKDNLIKQAQSFEQLGVAVQGELPVHWVERAELGLEQPNLLN